MNTLRSSRPSVKKILMIKIKDFGKMIDNKNDRSFLDRITGWTGLLWRIILSKFSLLCLSRSV